MLTTTDMGSVTAPAVPGHQVLPISEARHTEARGWGGLHCNMNFERDGPAHHQTPIIREDDYAHDGILKHLQSWRLQGGLFSNLTSGRCCS